LSIQVPSGTVLTIEIKDIEDLEGRNKHSGLADGQAKIHTAGIELVEKETKK